MGQSIHFGAVALCLVCIAFKTTLERKGVLEKTRPLLEPLRAGLHGQSLKHYHMGFPNLLADLIWIDLLQRASHEKLGQQRVSWEYAQLDAISTLDPNFERTYTFGVAYLSVFREDKLGAKLFLEKWVKKRPTYWHAHYALGHQLFRELGDFQGAAHHILKAASLEGAPAWLSALGIRLLSETGAQVNALEMAIGLYSEMKHPEARERLMARIRSLNFEMQKTAWTKALAVFKRAQQKKPQRIEEIARYLAPYRRSLAAHPLTEEEDRKLLPALREVFPFRYDPGKDEVVPAIDVLRLGLDKTGIFRQGEFRHE